jgi:hypothetical protein
MTYPPTNPGYQASQQPGGGYGTPAAPPYPAPAGGPNPGAYPPPAGANRMPMFLSVGVVVLGLHFSTALATACAIGAELRLQLNVSWAGGSR